MAEPSTGWVPSPQSESKARFNSQCPMPDRCVFCSVLSFSPVVVRGDSAAAVANPLGKLTQTGERVLSGSRANVVRFLRETRMNIANDP